MSSESKETTALVLVLIIAGVLVFSVGTNLISFGSFPERQVENLEAGVTYREALKNYGLENDDINRILEDRPENFGNMSIGRHILEIAPTETGATNVATSTLWDYRGYDTLGEATIIFVAICGVVALFRATKEE